MMVDISWLRQQFPEIISPQPLGRGGQKLVFTGRHASDGEVVLKLFHLNVDEERVMREVMAAQNVPSPRIPRIFEVGRTRIQVGDVIWVREERIPGRNLREVVATGQLPPRAVLTLAQHILEALAAAETVRIVHRDVKPDNILAADDGTFWLLDFGLARHLDLESLTATALPLGHGTPGYAPPEQFRNIKPDIDARADLFGLGVTLYECVEGRNPFRAGARDAMEMLRRVETQPLPPISRQVDAAGQFRDLVAAMTRRQPNHRPDTAAEAFAWIREINAAEGL